MMTTQKTFETVTEIWASQESKKKYDLFKTTKSGNLILEGNNPNKINQVIVTKYRCQDKGQTKLKALYPMNRPDRMNCIAGQAEVFVQGNWTITTRMNHTWSTFNFYQGSVVLWDSVYFHLVINLNVLFLYTLST